MRWYARERAIQRVARAATSGLDLVGFWMEARDALGPAVLHHITPCWYTLDPASLLVTSHYDHGLIPELPPEWLAHEYRAEDCHKLADIARGRAALSTIHDATGGDPSSSPRWQRFVQPHGGDQELLLALRTRNGEVWGVLARYRAPGQPTFDAEERELLTALAPCLAEGARRGLLGLTDREQDVARSVLGGLATVEIARTLHISPHTVQQHLKAIFDKTAVSSRRDLVAKVFFAYFEPRLRDNGQRALERRPLRGDPMTGPSQ